jgi:3-methyladenine DNA glycosylase AlkD
MRNQTNKSRSVFQSTKTAVSASVDIVVASAELVGSVATIGKDIVTNNLRAMHLSTIRDNNIENAVEVDECLDVCDERLTELEAVPTKGLTERQAKRLAQRLNMWDHVSHTIEATVKL